jgi:deazaflavin-dependent oxidoreductase (nitroreductase family)
MERPILTSGERWRRIFKRFNRLMLLLWWLGLGRWINAWPAVGGRIMVISHTGRKSGLRRRTPVNYVMVDGDVYCTAGFGPRSDWYRNLLANPQVELWLPGSRRSGWAEDVSGCEQHLALLRQVLIASGFAAYLAGINPRSISDAELQKVAADYRLVRIRLAGPVTTPSPGEPPNQSAP